jgi:HEAT repeat protein
MFGWWLRSKLNSKRTDTRLAALEALVEKQDHSAIDIVMEVLFTDPELEVREKAAWVLGELGGEKEFAALFGKLGEDDGKNRERIDALTQIDYAGTVDKLIASPGHVKAKEVLISLLADIGDETAKRALLDLLSDADYSIRKASAEGLRQLGWKPQSRREMMLAAIAEGDWQQVPKFRGDAVDPLLALLYPGSAVGRQVITALLETGDERAINALYKFIEEAKVASAEFNPSQITELLVSHLDNSDITIRSAAARTLHRLNWKPSDQILAVKYAIASGDPAKALKYGEDVREQLLDTARNESVPLSERWDFIVALKDLEPEMVFEMMMSVLERNAEGLGHRAAETLGEIGDPRALDALLAEARPASVLDPELRSAAIKSLARFRDSRATVFLLELQKSEDSVKTALDLLHEHLSLHAERIETCLLQQIATMDEVDQVVVEPDGGWRHEKIDHSAVKELAEREIIRRRSQ